jgi:ribosome biogenesis GTPase A
VAQQASRKPVFPPEIAQFIDVGAYLLDARAPAATLYLDEMLHGKELLLLTRAGQAEPKATRRWQHYLRRAGYPAVVIDSVDGRGLPEVMDYIAGLFQRKLALARQRGLQATTLRLAALGVPNVGKSTFLNALLGSRHLKTGDRPGITRGRQWVRLYEDVEVLDTPGVLREPAALNRRKPYWLLLNLMPYDFKLRDEALELLLEHLDRKALTKLWKLYKQAGEPDMPANAEALLGLVARAGGFRLDSDDALDRAARRVLRDFQRGRFGQLTLEEAGEAVITSPYFTAPVLQPDGNTP